MVSMTVTAGRGAFTRAELDALPDDGRRYELIDGSLVVTAAPAFGHQVVVGRLFKLFDDQQADDYVALVAPFDVVLAEDTGRGTRRPGGATRGIHR
jgi:hypothetical protein